MTHDLVVPDVEQKRRLWQHELARWFPAGERGRVQGIMLTTAQLGAVAAPTAAAYLIHAAGWRWAFVAFGAAAAFRFTWL